jgi:type IV pilus assembly protein PilE
MRQQDGEVTMLIKPGNKGFTLVEMIVVSLIVAILAAVAIPMYRGYIIGQRQATVDNLAQTAGAAANAYLRRTGVVPDNTNFYPKNTLGLYYNNGTSGYLINITSNTITVTDQSNTSIKNNTVNIN